MATKIGNRALAADAVTATNIAASAASAIRTKIGAEAAGAAASAVAAAIAVLPITKAYASAGQTITQAGLLTLAHGLAAMPKIVRTYLVCTTANAGYAIGDRLEYPPAADTNSTAIRGFALYFDAANINVRFANTAAVLTAANKGTGALETLTNGSWQLYVEAYA